MQKYSGTSTLKRRNNAFNFLKKFSKAVVFEQLISKNNLEIARIQLKNQFKTTTVLYINKYMDIICKISKKWFINTNKLLLEKKFQYPKQK